jgi:hypothetical protein
MTEMDVERLGTRERKILRRVQGPVVEQGMWRTRNDQELRELYRDLDIVAGIKMEEIGIDWILVRMDQGRTVKEIFESKRERSRRRGRPRLRWLEDVGEDLREMKVRHGDRRQSTRKNGTT